MRGAFRTETTMTIQRLKTSINSMASSRTQKKFRMTSLRRLREECPETAGEVSGTQEGVCVRTAAAGLFKSSGRGNSMATLHLWKISCWLLCQEWECTEGEQEGHSLGSAVVIHAAGDGVLDLGDSSGDGEKGLDTRDC